MPVNPRKIRTIFRAQPQGNAANASTRHYPCQSTLAEYRPRRKVLRFLIAGFPSGGALTTLSAA